MNKKRSLLFVLLLTLVVGTLQASAQQPAACFDPQVAEAAGEDLGLEGLLTPEPQPQTSCSAESDCYWPPPWQVECSCASGTCETTGPNGTVTCTCSGSAPVEKTCNQVPVCNDSPYYCSSEQVYVPCPSGTVHCKGHINRYIDCWDQNGAFERRWCSRCGIDFMCLE